MSVVLCIPSARPPAEAIACMEAWLARGYHCFIQRDQRDEFSALYDNRNQNWDGGPYVRVFVRPYEGYAKAVNFLTRVALMERVDCNWCVAGGDDTLPDPNHTAEEIAAQCSRYFARLHAGPSSQDLFDKDTFGVMQPTGHRWGDRQGAYIDRVAGSAWLGREWCRRANQGAGPLYPEFQHMFVDECLQETAKALGVFWQRPDLIHFHNHWGLPKEGQRLADTGDMPEHLKKWNSPGHWQASKDLFERLKKNGFKECMPIP